MMMPVDRLRSALLRFPQVRLSGTGHWSELDFLIICYLDLGSDRSRTGGGPGLFNNSVTTGRGCLINSRYRVSQGDRGNGGGTQNNTDNCRVNSDLRSLTGGPLLYRLQSANNERRQSGQINIIQ